MEDPRSSGIESALSSQGATDLRPDFLDAYREHVWHVYGYLAYRLRSRAGCRGPHPAHVRARVQGLGQLRRATRGRCGRGWSRSRATRSSIIGAAGARARRPRRSGAGLAGVGRRGRGGSGAETRHRPGAGGGAGASEPAGALGGRAALRCRPAPRRRSPRCLTSASRTCSRSSRGRCDSCATLLEGEDAGATHEARSAGSRS